MNFLKKQGIGIWITLGAVLLSVIALIIYGAALGSGMNLQIASGSDMFYDVARKSDTTMMTMVVTFGVIALVFMAAALVLGQFEFNGIAGKIVDGVVSAMRIVAPALLIAAFLNFLYGSFTGLGWTFFSNEELYIYPAATAVGKQVITGIVFFVIAAITAIVASFFALTKKTAD